MLWWKHPAYWSGCSCCIGKSLRMQPPGVLLCSKDCHGSCKHKSHVASAWSLLLGCWVNWSEEGLKNLNLMHFLQVVEGVGVMFVSACWIYLVLSLCISLVTVVWEVRGAFWRGETSSSSASCFKTWKLFVCSSNSLLRPGHSPSIIPCHSDGHIFNRTHCPFSTVRTLSSSTVIHSPFQRSRQLVAESLRSLMNCVHAERQRCGKAGIYWSIHTGDSPLWIWWTWLKYDIMERDSDHIPYGVWGVSTAGGCWMEGWHGGEGKCSWSIAWGWGMTCWRTCGCLCGWHFLCSIPVSWAWAVDSLQHPKHNFTMHLLFPSVHVPHFVTHVEFEQAVYSVVVQGLCCR